MREIRQDVRFALRTLRNGWGITLVAVLSLAVAIGGNATVFSLVSQILFAPTSVVEPGRVVLIQERQKDQSTNLSTFSASLGTWADLRDRVRSAAAWGAMRFTGLGLRGPERSESVSGARVTPGFFEMIGVPPARGRGFRSEEGDEGGARVAVVTPEFWERHGKGGDPLGETLVLDGEPHQVVGLLPPEFRFLFSTVEVWVPLMDRPMETSRDQRNVYALARLAPGAEMDRLEAEVAALAPRLEAEHPGTYEGWTLDVLNLEDDVPTSQTRIFYGLLQGSVFFVLLIACANITNLLLARGQERTREIALRSVLGAGRGRIFRQLLTESGVMVGLGLALGLGLGWYGIRVLASRISAVAPAIDPSLDLKVILFTTGVSAVAGLLVGVAPALQTLRTDHSEALKEGSKSSAGRGRKLVSRALVMAEICLSLVALAGGGMLVRSFLELRGGDPGFDPEPILTARVRMPASSLSDDEQMLLFLDDVLERAGGLGGVTAATLVNALPRSFGAPTDTFRVEGRTMDPAADAPRAFSLQASPGYLETFGVAILRGRFFQDGDGPGAPPVAVVNRSFAEARFPGESPLGARVHFRGVSREVVGVVDDVLQVLVQTPGSVQSEAIYVPVAQEPSRSVSVAVRAQGDPDLLTEPLRSTLHELDRDLTVTRVLTMEEAAEQNFAGINIFNAILGTFGVLAILLASVGTYGVLAYTVSRRRREIGIRVALGARKRAVVRMVAGQGVRMAMVGLALGGLLLIPVTHLIRSLMEGIATVRADTAWGVAALLFLVTLVASLVPAWRAAELDPVEALHDG